MRVARNSPFQKKREKRNGLFLKCESKVQGTNDCSIVSKHSSAEKGYVDDIYLKAFIFKPQQRSPLINRGYYIRYKAIQTAFSSWWKIMHCTPFKNFQVISLGAGFDTSYFRLKSDYMFLPGSRYIEVDFPEVMNRKLSCIMSDQDLKNLIDVGETNNAPKHSQIVFWSSEYVLLGVDLGSVYNLQNVMSIIGIDYMLPTMFLSECAITYMDAEKSSLIIQWAKRMFPNSAFITYEQVYPTDGFGHVMQNHFISIGSPLKSLLVYPDIVAQQNRYLTEGWESSLVIGVSDLYSSFSTEEKNRIQELELFDEYEMWHQKCSHYVLICATQGGVRCMDDFLKTGILRKGDHEISYAGIVHWEKCDSSCIIERYAHQSVLLSSGSIVVSGGFGHVRDKHQRLGGLILVDSKLTTATEVVLLDPKSILGKRMHHTLMLLTDGRIVVFGGRTSPAKAFGDMVILSLKKSFIKEVESSSNSESKLRGGAKNEDCFQHNCKSFVGPLLENTSVATREGELQNQNPPLQYACEHVCLMGSPISCRWRHSTSGIVHEGVEKLVVFGGCTVKQNALNDCYIIDTQTWMCSTVPLTSGTPCPRHSHSSSTYKSSQVLIAGGLTAGETVLNTVHALDIITFKWTQLPVVGLIPRYSHTAHIWKNTLILVGGVNTFPNHPPGVSVIDLITFQAKEFKLPGQDPEYPILLNNHCSCIKDEKIVILGGGGNCFSFGTHFNENIMCIDINQLFVQ